MGLTDLHPLLDISAVDFGDVDDAVGFATLVFAMGNRTGMLTDSGKRQSREAVALAGLARQWVSAVASRLQAMSPGEALQLSDALGVMQRMAGGLGKRSDRLVLNAFEARQQGDRTVDEYALFRAIGHEISRKNGPFFGSPLAWHSTSLDRWWRNFEYGASVGRLSDDDTISQVGILMGENLWAFVADERRYKERLIKAHSRYFGQTADMSPTTLGHLDKLLTASRPYLTDTDFTAHSTAITTALITHPKTNRYYKASLSII